MAMDHRSDYQKALAIDRLEQQRERELEIEIKIKKAQIAAAQAEAEERSKTSLLTLKPVDNSPALASLWHRLTETDRGYLYAYALAMAHKEGIQVNMATFPFMKVRLLKDVLNTTQPYFRDDPFVKQLLDKLG